MNTCIRVFADSIQISRCREDLKNKEESFLELADVLNLAGNAWTGRFAGAEFSGVMVEAVISF